jgi:hypothetical protein
MTKKKLIVISDRRSKERITMPFGVRMYSLPMSDAEKEYQREHISEEMASGRRITPLHVQPGEFRVSHAPGVLDADTHGPCVGVAIYDRKTRIGLLAHLMPEAASPMHYAHMCVGTILDHFSDFIDDWSGVSVQLFGGHANDKLGKAVAKEFGKWELKADASQLGKIAGKPRFDLSTGTLRTD